MNFSKKNFKIETAHNQSVCLEKLSGYNYKYPKSKLKRAFCAMNADYFSDDNYDHLVK